MTDPSARAIGLVLAGHHPLTLCGLIQVFEKESDCTVLAVCTDTDSVLEVVRQHHPDIVMLDLDQAGVFSVLRRLQRERLSARAVVLAAAADGAGMVDAMRLGASAVVFKELPPDAFVASVRKVYGAAGVADEPPLDTLLGKVSRRGKSTRHAGRRLTPREAEIARLAAKGISTREIAEHLELKQGTVKIHLHSIYEKLNVGGRLGLILFARRRGLA